MTQRKLTPYLAAASLTLGIALFAAPAFVQKSLNDGGMPADPPATAVQSHGKATPIPTAPYYGRDAPMMVEPARSPRPSKSKPRSRRAKAPHRRCHLISAGRSTTAGRPKVKPTELAKHRSRQDLGRLVKAEA